MMLNLNPWVAVAAIMVLGVLAGNVEVLLP